MAMIGRALRRLIACPTIAGDAVRTTASAGAFCRHAEATVLLQQGALSGGPSSARQSFSTDSANSSGSGSDSSGNGSNSSGNGGNGSGNDSNSTRYPRLQEEVKFPLAGTLNKSILLGYVGSEPRVKTLRNGRLVICFPVATKGKSIAREVEASSSSRDSDNDKMVDVSPKRHVIDVNQWHRVAIYHDYYGQTAMSYLQKGARVYVEGLNEIRHYVDGSGIMKTVREIAVRHPSGMVLPLEKTRPQRRLKQALAVHGKRQPEMAQVNAVDDSSNLVAEEEGQKVDAL